MSIVIPQAHYEAVESGEYMAEIVGIDSTITQFGQQLKFYFALSNGGNVDRKTICGWCHPSFTTKTKLYRWTKAALGGAEINTYYNFNSDDLVGRKVIINVEKRVNDNGGFSNKITDVKPYNPTGSPGPIVEPPSSPAPSQNTLNWAETSEN